MSFSDKILDKLPPETEDSNDESMTLRVCPICLEVSFFFLIVNNNYTI